MSESERIEQQIREILARENSAITLSNRLFRPDGLFARLGPTEEQRRIIVKSPLFKEAQRRFSELQRKEAAAFTQVLQQAQITIPGDNGFIKLEITENT
jgi:hypothetical protein